MAEPIYITNFKITNEPPFGDLEFALPDPSKLQHIIFTGKNGSGKSRLLKRLYKSVKGIEDNKVAIKTAIDSIKNDTEWLTDSVTAVITNKNQFYTIKNRLEENNIRLKSFLRDELKFGSTGSTFVEFGDDSFIAFLAADRRYSFDTPQLLAAESEFTRLEKSKDSANTLSYALSRYVQLAIARLKEEQVKSDKIQAWFDEFNRVLQTIMNNPLLQIEVDTDSLSVSINDAESTFKFNDLSAGYISYFTIIVNLIWGMGSIADLKFNKSGIVFIDEIENHLHVSLQKTILPHLIELFPNVQFIVATHSPFVLNSVSNAVVYDMDKKELLQDMSRYSYDTLIEGYFNHDSYSNLLKVRISQLEEQVSKILEAGDRDRASNQLQELRKEFETLPRFLLNPDGVIAGNELLQKLSLLEIKLMAYVQGS